MPKINLFFINIKLFTNFSLIEIFLKVPNSIINDSGLKMIT